MQFTALNSPGSITRLFSILCLLLVPQLRAQWEEVSHWIEEMPLPPSADVAEEWLYWVHHPVNPNDANVLTLQQLPGLSRELASAIIRERQLRGPFRSWMDFSARLHLDQRMWKPYRALFRWDSRKVKPSWSVRMGTECRAEPVQGFLADRFHGSPEHLQLRMNGSWAGGNRELALALEKDAGESFPDHAAGFIRIPAGSADLIAGWYGIQCGQGLGLWPATGFYRESYPLRNVRSSRGIRGYAGSQESGHLLGLGIQTNTTQNRAFIAAACTPRDGRVEEGRILSLNTTGLHRTDSEMARKNRILEYTLAGGADLVKTGFQVGAWGFVTGYSHRAAQNSTRNIPPGQPYGTAGIHGRLPWHDGCLAFETVLIPRATGLTVSAGHDFGGLSLGLSLRSLGTGFYSVHGHGFGMADPSSHRCMTLELNWKHSAVHVSAYAEWLTYTDGTATLPVPTMKIRYEGEVQVKKKRWAVICRFQALQNPDMQHGVTDYGITVPGILPRFQQNIRLEFTARVHTFQSRFRWEGIRVHYPGQAGDVQWTRKSEMGTLFLTDLRWKPRKSLSMRMRSIFFFSPSYDSRIYEAEADIPGRIQTVFLYGRGYRLTLLVAHTWNKHVSWAIKSAVTRRLDTDTMGSGIQLINGSSNRIVEIQLNTRF